MKQKTKRNEERKKKYNNGGKATSSVIQAYYEHRMRNTFTVDDERICQDASSDARIKFNIECTASNGKQYANNSGNSDTQTRTHAQSYFRAPLFGLAKGEPGKCEENKIEKWCKTFNVQFCHEWHCSNAVSQSHFIGIHAPYTYTWSIQ